MTPIEGVDYAFPPNPTAARLAIAGKKFACRYLGPGSDSKHLTAGELTNLRAAGIDVVANAEGAANGFRGVAAGKSWATSALADARALDMPAGRPIYFSVDWDAGPADWADIDAALKGAAGVIGAANVGIYGSYDVIQHVKAAGTARWFWQTYAWSGGKLHSAAHLYQWKNSQTIGGADCDFTRALQPDYGQWGIDDMPSVQDVLDGFYRDLKNDDSGINQQLRRIQREEMAKFMDASRSWTGSPGDRITARGWGQISPWTLLEYLMEMVATDPKVEQADDGTTIKLSGGILPRLDRIEDAVTAQPAPEPAPES